MINYIDALVFTGRSNQLKELTISLVHQSAKLQDSVKDSDQEILKLLINFESSLVSANCLADLITSKMKEYDPTPWCHVCNSTTKKECNCGNRAEND